MVNFNEYINEIDFSEFKKHFLEKGKSIEIKKKDYFVRQNEPCKYVGFVESGIFRYTRIDNAGNEPVTDCSVYVLSMKELNDFWETSINTQRFGRLVAEEIFVEMYQRLLGFYCDTAEQRYVALLKRCTNLPQHITLKEIASFLGVTPETVSHIRRKLRQK